MTNSPDSLELPPPKELADEHDELGWDREVIGTPDEAVAAHVDDEIPDVADYDPARDKHLNPNRWW